jgi:hypothetical protein
MKYLKTYEEISGFTTLTDEMKSDLKDILLELTDVGFTVIFERNYIAPRTPSSDYILIGKDQCVLGGQMGKYKTFKWSDISEVMSRITEYMAEEHRYHACFNSNYLESDPQKIVSTSIYFMKIPSNI